MQQSFKQIAFSLLLQTYIVQWQFVHMTETESDPNHSSASFNYHNLNEWLNNYPQSYGKLQSPIEMDPSKILIVNQSCELEFEGYDKVPKRMTLENIGHSVKLTAEWLDSAPYTSAGHLKSKYVLDNVHFHWGANDSEGSEHTFENTSFPLEMHLVHYKKDYGDEKKAEERGDGYLVIGMVFQISDTEKSNLLPLAKSLSLVKYEGNTTEVDPFQLSTFNFHPKSGYISYMGSLTTPPCSQNVIWLFSTQVLSVATNELKLFRSLELAYGDKSNHRPIRPLNDRKILYLPKW